MIILNDPQKVQKNQFNSNLGMIIITPPPQHFLGLTDAPEDLCARKFKLGDFRRSDNLCKSCWTVLNGCFSSLNVIHEMFFLCDTNNIHMNKGDSDENSDREADSDVSLKGLSYSELFLTQEGASFREDKNGERKKEKGNSKEKKMEK